MTKQILRTRLGSVLQAATYYIGLLWAPIPIPYRKKGPVIRNWQTLYLTLQNVAQYFRETPTNIGILLGECSKWLIDIDLDCPEAVALASIFLPKTNAVFGRASKPRSHFFYYSRGTLSKRFQSGEGTVVEIRSTGAQTVVPPSVHEGGEAICWDEQGEPAEVTTADINVSVARLAAASLLTRHWPTEGARNNAALALSGALLQAGWGQAETEHFVGVVAEYGGSKKVGAKVKTVTSTLKRMDADQPVTGLPTLRQLFPPAVVNKVAEWLALRVKEPSRVASAECTDVANGERLARKYGHVIRWVREAKQWFIYSEDRWQLDRVYFLQEKAISVARGIEKDTMQSSTPVEQKALKAWSIVSQQKTRIEAMIALARHHYTISYEDFDVDPYLLNVKNGTINLKTGTLRPHDSKDFLTHYIPISYEPDRECPKWEAFLNVIFGGDVELIRFIQLAIGYTLTGITSEQCFFMLHGLGSNGKSVFLEVLQALLGDYGRPMETRSLTQKWAGSDAVRNDVAGLRGCRLAAASEIRPGAQLDEALVKSLTGDDCITARFLFQEYFDFHPSFKIWMAVNHLPSIRGKEEAIWRRVRLVPFNATISPGQQIRGLAKELIEQEGAGILAWAVRGCLQWQSEGLPMPNAIRGAVDSYRSSSDGIQEFLSVCCEPEVTTGTQSGRVWVACSDLYSEYTSWCQRNADEPVSRQEFGSVMRIKGYSNAQKWYDNANHKVYKGLRLRAQKPMSEDATVGVGEIDFGEEDDLEGWEDF